MFQRVSPSASAMVFPCILLAAGCGGGEEQTGARSFQATLPELTNDFSAFAGGESFSGTGSLVQAESGTGAASTFDIAVRPADDGSGDIIVNVDGGNDIRLDRNAATGQYVFSDVTGTLFAESVMGEDVGTLLLVAEGGGTTSAGFLVVGRESVDVAAQSGKALYLGPSAFIAVSDTGALNGGGGGFVLEANFDTASVDGVIALTDSASSTQFQIGFENAPISGNGFSSASLQQTGLNGTVTASGLDAAFYGGSAAEVGGTYTMNLATGGNTTFLAGAMIGSRQSADIEDIVASSGGSVDIGGGESVVLGSGSLVGGSGSVYPDGSSSYYNSSTGVSYGADSSGCYYVGDWSNC